MQTMAPQDARGVAVIRAATLTAVMCGLSSSAVLAQTYTYNRIDGPRTTFTEARAVSNNGLVAGDYSSAKSVTTAFMVNAKGRFVPLAPKGSASAQATGINSSGQVIGDFTDSAGAFHGFLYSNGKFMTLDPAGSTGAVAWGINDNGQVVGSFTDASSPNGGHGFLYTPPSSTATLDATPVTSTSFTAAFAINSAGDVAGSYYDATRHGYEYIGGTYTTIDYPSTTFTQAIGINATDQVVGFYSDSSSNTHGFLYDAGTHTYTSLDPAGSTFSVATGINDAGQVVGYFTDAAGKYHGFAYSGGVFTTLDPPGSTGAFTLANGINNAGQIVGEFQDSLGTTHGFLATPQ